MQRMCGSCLLLLLLCLAASSGLGADRNPLPDKDRAALGRAVTTTRKQEGDRGLPDLLPAAPQASADRDVGPTDPTGVRNRLYYQLRDQRTREKDGNSGEGQQRQHRL